MEPHSFGHTRDVTNQAPPLADYNLFSTDVALSAALEREGAAWHREALERHVAWIVFAGVELVAQCGEQRGFAL